MGAWSNRQFDMFGNVIDPNNSDHWGAIPVRQPVRQAPVQPVGLVQQVPVAEHPAITAALGEARRAVAFRNAQRQSTSKTRKSGRTAKSAPTNAARVAIEPVNSQRLPLRANSEAFASSVPQLFSELRNYVISPEDMQLINQTTPVSSYHKYPWNITEEEFNNDLNTWMESKRRGSGLFNSFGGM